MIRSAFLGLIACLALLAFGCASTEERKRPSVLPEDPSQLDLRYYQEADESRLFLELDKLVRQWRNASLNDQPVIVKGVAEQIERYSQANLRMVLDGLDSENPRFRWVAAASLGFSGRQEAVGPLASALKDSDEAIVVNALLSLAQLSPLERDVIPTLLALLDRDSAWIRSGALSVLGKNLRPEDAGRALLPLLAALQDPDDVVRNNALGALGRLRDPRAFDPLVRLLVDPFPRIRIRAALALGELEDPRAVPALIPLLEDPSKPVVRAAERALEQITKKDFGTDGAAWMRWWGSLPPDEAGS